MTTTTTTTTTTTVTTTTTAAAAAAAAAENNTIDKSHLILCEHLFFVHQFIWSECVRSVTAAPFVT